MEMAVDGWALVATLDITLVPGGEEVAQWKNVATLTITLVPGTGEVAQWKLVDTKTITLVVPTIVCSKDADCPEGYLCVGGVCVKKKGLPWTSFAIAGAAVAGIILIISGQQKRKKKEKKK